MKLSTLKRLGILSLFLISTSVSAKNAFSNPEQAMEAYKAAAAFNEVAYCGFYPLYDEPLDNVFDISDPVDDSVYDAVTPEYLVISFGDCSGGSGTGHWKFSLVSFLRGTANIDIESGNDDWLESSGIESKAGINRRFIEKVTQPKRGILHIVGSSFSENSCGGNNFPDEHWLYEIDVFKGKLLSKKLIRQDECKLP